MTSPNATKRAKSTNLPRQWFPFARDLIARGREDAPGEWYDRAQTLALMSRLPLTTCRAIFRAVEKTPND